MWKWHAPLPMKKESQRIGMQEIKKERAWAWKRRSEYEKTLQINFIFHHLRHFPSSKHQFNYWYCLYCVCVFTLSCKIFVTFSHFQNFHFLREVHFRFYRNSIRISNIEFITHTHTQKSKFSISPLSKSVIIEIKT